MGGVAVTYRDASRQGKPIGVFGKFAELNVILHKVAEATRESITSLEFTSSRSYRYTERMHEENPAVEALLPSSERYKLVTSAFTLPVFHAERPDDGREYVRMYGLADTKRAYRWVRRDYTEGAREPRQVQGRRPCIPKRRRDAGRRARPGHRLLTASGAGDRRNSNIHQHRLVRHQGRR